MSISLSGWIRPLLEREKGSSPDKDLPPLPWIMSGFLSDSSLSPVSSIGVFVVVVSGVEICILMPLLHMYYIVHHAGDRCVLAAGGGQTPRCRCVSRSSTTGAKTRRTDPRRRISPLLFASSHVDVSTQYRRGLPIM